MQLLTLVIHIPSCLFLVAMLLHILLNVYATGHLDGVGVMFWKHHLTLTCLDLLRNQHPLYLQRGRKTEEDVWTLLGRGS